MPCVQRCLTPVIQRDVVIERDERDLERGEEMKEDEWFNKEGEVRQTFR